MKPIPIKSPKRKKSKISFKFLLLVLLVGGALYFIFQKKNSLQVSLDKQCKAFKLVATQKSELKIRSQSLNNYIIDKTIFAGEEIQFGDSKGVEIELKPTKSAILIYGNKELNWNQLAQLDKNIFSFKCY